MATVQVTEKNFDATVKQGIVLLDFWASWCGPCRALALRSLDEQEPTVPQVANTGGV